MKQEKVGNARLIPPLIRLDKKDFIEKMSKEELRNWKNIN